MKRLLASVVVAAIGLGDAFASQVTFHYSAIVDSATFGVDLATGDPLPWPDRVGDAIFGSVTYDTLPSSHGSLTPNTKLYDLSGAEIDFPTIGLHKNSADDLSFVSVTHGPGSDDVFGFNNDFDVGTTIFSFALTAPSGTVFDSTDAPLSVPPLAAFTLGNSFTLISECDNPGEVGTSVCKFHGHLTALVSEPASIWLLALAVTCAAWVSKVRAQRYLRPCLDAGGNC
jgi:hypothetical protein